jgi:CubicO group peptidase (beta-lactamase class C family)
MEQRMKTRIILICLSAILIGGCQTTSSSPLNYDVLLNGSDFNSPVDNHFLALPEDADPPDHIFEGYLELIDEATGGSAKIIQGGEGLASEANHLPEFDFEFVQSGSYLIPARRGLSITEHPMWNIILEPGRVWQQKGDRGLSRASFPFTLVVKGGNSSFNGAMTFLFDDMHISKVWYQVTQETAISFRMDMWGLLNASYHPEIVENAGQIRQSFEQELANRFPTRPIEQLAEDYPDVNIEAFSRHVLPENMTTYGVVVNGVNYRGDCPTRYGNYPYCEWVRMASFSTAKTAFVSMAMMRLGQKYNPHIAELLVKDYVPEAADSPGDWDKVTFNNLLDMATGNFSSFAYMVDEEGRIFNEFFSLDKYKDMIRVAFDWPHKAEPGTLWNYRSSDTFIAVQALQNYLRTREGPNADLFDFIVREVYEPVKLGPGIFTTQRTSENNWQGHPLGATGMWWIPDDIAKLTTLLNVNHGKVNGEQLLLSDMLTGALQADPNDRGVKRPGGMYNNTFWADAFTSANGYDCSFYVPYMAGYSGNIIALMPNGVTYYYFSDNRDFNWHDAVREADRIAPLCPASAREQTTTITGGQSPLPFDDEIQQALNDGLVATNGAGVSAAVIVPGYQPWTGASGYSFVEPGGFVSMRPDMLFQIASVDKTFIAALMLQLVEEGKFNLDDPISRWVSGYPQIDSAVTVRQILNHTSGIYDWEDNSHSFTSLLQNKGYQIMDWGAVWTLDDIMALVEEPDFPPGQGWHYSNTGYYLARYIIESETGLPIAKVLRTRLLDPLGLNHTWVECDQPATEGVEFAHIYYDVNGDTNLDDISDQPKTFLCTALEGPIWTTAEDLARWSQALFYEGRVLNEESLAEMLTFVDATGDPTEPEISEYGLGVARYKLRVLTTDNSPRLVDLNNYGHNGNGIGYDAMMIYLPEYHATVVTLFNENFSMYNTAGTLLEVVDRNLGGSRILSLNNLQFLFVVSAFLFQLVLITHFSLRKWRFDLAMRIGWLVYLLSVPAAAVSVILLLGDEAWSFWLSGFLYLTWAIYGFTVEYVKHIEWRNPIRWPTFGIYVFLYIATSMFYWFPLGLINKSLWSVYTVLFIVSTIFNASSHKRAKDVKRSIID